MWNKKNNWVGGFARVGGDWIVIKLPESMEWIMWSNIGELSHKSEVLATIFIHEIGHLLKIKHHLGMTIEHLFAKNIIDKFDDANYPVK